MGDEIQKRSIKILSIKNNISHLNLMVQMQIDQ